MSDKETLPFFQKRKIVRQQRYIYAACTAKVLSSVELGHLTRQNKDIKARNI